MGYVSCQEDIDEQQGDNAHQRLHDAKQSFIASPGFCLIQENESQHEMLQEIARLKKHVRWLEEQLLQEKTKRKQLQSQVAQEGKRREKAKSKPRQPKKTKSLPVESRDGNGFSSTQVKKSQKTCDSSNRRIVHPILEIRLTQDIGQPIVKKIESPSHIKHEWTEWKKHYL